MPLLTRKMPSFEGVAAGQTATARLPIGLSYHQLLLAYSGATLAQLDEIRIVANGRVLHRFATADGSSGGQVLDKINQFEGRAAANGILLVDFNRHNLLTRDGQEVTRLGTGKTSKETGAVELSTLTMEVDINAAAVNPALSLKAIQGAPAPAGVVKKLRHFVYSASGAGDFEIADLPRGDLINKIVIHSTNVNSLKVERDNAVIFERDTAENNLVQADGKRVNVAGLWVYDPTEKGYGADSLVTKGVQDLRLTLNMAGADTLPITVEYLGGIEG